MTGDEYDPLRERFDAEPFLLAPPPGQLGMVTARARRRRRLRLSAVLASSVASLAVVFAGGALVASKLVTGHETRPVTGRPTDTPTTPPSAAPKPTAPVAIAPSQLPRVRPAGDTELLDLTWISTETGWAIGRVHGCTSAKGCPPADRPGEYAVLHTTDGARTWDQIATLPGKSCCVFTIRFASKTTGYLILDGRLLVSTDAGRTWLPSGLDAYSVAVEAGRDTVTVLTNDSVGDAMCGPCRVWASPLGVNSWQQTLTLQSWPLAVLRRSGDLVLAAGLANPAGGASGKAADLHLSRDGGVTWSEMADPCVAAIGRDETEGYALSFDVAGSVLAAHCDAYTASGTPFERQYVLRSSDAGKSFKARQDGTECSYSAVLVADAETLVCAALGGVQVSRDGGASWSLRLRDTSRYGYRCGFQTGLVGRCYWGSQVWTTRDAGQTWHRRDVSAS